MENHTYCLHKNKQEINISKEKKWKGKVFLISLCLKKNYVCLLFNFQFAQNEPKLNGTNRSIVLVAAFMDIC